MRAPSSAAGDIGLAAPPPGAVIFLGCTLAAFGRWVGAGAFVAPATVG